MSVYPLLRDMPVYTFLDYLSLYTLLDYMSVYTLLHVMTKCTLLNHIFMYTVLNYGLYLDYILQTCALVFDIYKTREAGTIRARFEPLEQGRTGAK